MDAFIIKAAVAGCALGVVTAPLGCLVVWRRMSYFGAALSHAALLGVALGLALNIDLKVSMFLVSALCAFALHALMGKPGLSADTLLGILAHSTLAGALVILSFMDNVRTNLIVYLFGDVLAVSAGDLAWIGAGGALVLAATAALWRQLLSATIHADLARVDGDSVGRTDLAFLLMLSIVIAISMQIVGLLLIVSLLIIPAATARGFARSPEHMAGLAAAISIASVLGGLLASYLWDLPAGPAIVSVAALAFAISYAIAGRIRGAQMPS